MEKITAPFTNEQVKKLNNYQKNGRFHPFTCCSHDGCDRINQKDEGLLIATNEGFICPCGKYEQKWAHKFMSEDIQPLKPKTHMKTKNKIKKLIGTGKTEAQYKKQAKRWFNGNPNRSVILMKIDKGEILITRNSILK